MRLPAIFALAALAGLAACDRAKVNELTGAKPPVAATVPAACPPAVAPACPPAQPAMPPEAAKAPPPAAPVSAHGAKVRRAALAKPLAARHAKRVVAHRRHIATRLPPVTRNAYAGGYTGEDGGYGEHRRYEHRYARPDEAYERQERYYDRREDGYDRYTFERREDGHPPYVEERNLDRYGHEAYRYDRREGSQDGYSYERPESYASGGGHALPPPPRPDDCDCQPRAAGRDRQGFLTWPGKQP